MNFDDITKQGKATCSRRNSNTFRSGLKAIVQYDRSNSTTVNICLFICWVWPMQRWILLDATWRDVHQWRSCIIHSEPKILYRFCFWYIFGYCRPIFI